MRALLVTMALAIPAAHRGAVAGPAPATAWSGQVRPVAAMPPCADCTGLAPVQRAAMLVVLPPKDVALPAGDVVIVQPLVGIALIAHLDQGRAVLPWFLVDKREGDNGVLVLPAGTAPHIVTIAAADLAQIKAALLRNEVLSHVAKAVAKLEIAGVDRDGDGKADFAVTYGCTAWGDGACQLHGQFLLERRAGKWVELE